jgi:hypothetical protein
MSYALGHTTEATKAGPASLRLLEDLGPTPQLAWSLANMALLAAFSYDPACADYAARAIGFVPTCQSFPTTDTLTVKGGS